MSQLPNDERHDPSLRESVRAVGDSIAVALDGIVEGAAEDVRKFGSDIAINAIRIAKISDKERRDSALQEISSQLKLLAEINRIRVNRESWEVFEKITTAATNVLVSFISNSATRF